MTPATWAKRLAALRHAAFDEGLRLANAAAFARVGNTEGETLERTLAGQRARDADLLLADLAAAHRPAREIPAGLPDLLYDLAHQITSTHPGLAIRARAYAALLCQTPASAPPADPSTSTLGGSSSGSSSSSPLPGAS